LGIDAEIFNRQGIGIARIERGKFHPAKSEHELSYSRRPDKHTLIVYGARSQVLLYIRFSNPHLVIVHGIFNSPSCKSPLVVTRYSMITPRGMRFRRNVADLDSGGYALQHTPSMWSFCQ
jgi:hypothetical protein